MAPLEQRAQLLVAFVRRICGVWAIKFNELKEADQVEGIRGSSADPPEASSRDAVAAFTTRCASCRASDKRGRDPLGSDFAL